MRVLTWVARVVGVTCCDVPPALRCCCAARISGGMDPGRWINIGIPPGDTAATADCMAPAADIQTDRQSYIDICTSHCLVNIQMICECDSAVTGRFVYTKHRTFLPPDLVCGTVYQQYTI